MSVRSRRRRPAISPVPWEAIPPLAAVYLYFAWCVFVLGQTVIL